MADSRHDAAATADELRRLRAAIEEQRPRRAGRLWAVAVVCLAVGAVLTLTGARAFARPVPLTEGYAAVDVAWQTDEPATRGAREPNAARAWVEVVTDGSVDSDTTVRIWFPPEAAGRPFLLALTATARFEDPTSRDTRIRAESHRCQEVPGLVEDCQLLFGTVPAEQGLTSGTHACWPPDRTSDAGPVVEVRGRTGAVEHVDLFHTVAAAPAVHGSPFATRARDYQRVPLPSTYALAELSGCTVVRTSPVEHVVDWYPDGATRTDTGMVQATGHGRGEWVVLTRDRDAEFIGQALIAVGATVAGLGVGFVPAAVDAHRVNADRRRTTGQK